MTFLDSIFLSIAAFSAGISIVVIYSVIKWFITGEQF
jgi:hypothetical protein